MNRMLFLTLMAAALGGCTAIHETLSPHRDLQSPCACLEDAIPINDAAFLEMLA